MPYVLGIDIGTGSTVVAVARLQRGGWGPPEVVTIPSTLPLDGDGPQVAHGFLRRVGDDVPMVLADRPYRAAALVAELVERIVERTAAAEGGPAEQVVVCVPGTWGPGRTEQSRAARYGQSCRYCQAVVPHAGSVGVMLLQKTPDVPQPVGSPFTLTACEMHL